MAELLIKGMEMTDRPITLVLYPNGDVDHLTEDNRYETIAKAIEVKPHGRCIDADAFIKQNKEGFKEPLMQGGDTIGIRVIPMDAVSRALDDAPTVLEAST